MTLNQHSPNPPLDSSDSLAAAPAERRRGDRLPLVMFGTPDRLSQEVSRVGVEGAPADPRSGAGLLTVELGIALVFLLLVAGAAAWLLGWVSGLAVLAIGLVGMVFNPVVPATVLRARDRMDIASHRSADAQRSPDKARDSASDHQVMKF